MSKCLLVGSISTNARGYYEFPGLADGIYKVQVNKKWYDREKKKAKVIQGKPWADEEFINFILIPGP